jgi:chromosome segregation ATPase
MSTLFLTAMTLTTDDKQWIKGAITEGIVDALNEIVIPRFEAIESRLDSIESRLTSLERDMRDVKERLGYVEGEIQALTNDIKEIYNVIYKKPNKILVSEMFAKMSDEDKITTLHDELQKLAKKKGVVLPQ